MVEVFKTNVPDKHIAQELVSALLQQLPDCRINFDLDDCDRILRIESEYIDDRAVVKLVQANGFLCEVLE